MEKKKIVKNIGKEKEIDLEEPCEVPTIKDIVSFLNEAKKEGATHIKFGGWVFDGIVGDVYMQPIKYELESDYDFQVRKSMDNNHNKMVRDSEIANLKRLKAKYPNE